MKTTARIAPSGVPDVGIYLLCMQTAVDEDLLYAGMGEELKSILDQGSVGKREEALENTVRLRFPVPGGEPILLDVQW